MTNYLKAIIKKSLLLFLLLPVLSFGQTKNAPPVSLESPHNTMLVHLYYLQLDSYHPEIAAQTLNGVRDTTKAKQLAIQLKQILDGKGLYVELEKVPQEQNYFDSLTNKAFYTPFPAMLPGVYLEQVGNKWLYSTETVEQIPALHKEVYSFGVNALLNWLQNFGNGQFLGLYTWQYVGIAIFLIALALLHFILSSLLNPIVRRLSQSRLKIIFIDEKLIKKIARIISILIIIQFSKIFLPALQLPILVAQAAIIILKIVSAFLLVLLVLRILDVFMLYVQRFTEKTESKLDEQLMPIVKKMLQAVIVVVGLIYILGFLDIDVTALIAGLSIGGLALALAAQDTVKNLIGSAMIFIDQPFQIGDWIEGGGIAGSVVEVGFRTTRLQQSDSSIISVPNGTIANMSITNKGVRVFRLFQTTLGVTYDTSPEKIEQFIAGLKKIIDLHPLAMKETKYVVFHEMAASSLNILFRVPLEVNSYAEELKAKEELLLAVLKLAEVMGIGFAFPSTSVYLEKVGEAEPEEEKLEEKVAHFLEGYKRQFKK